MADFWLGTFDLINLTSGSILSSLFPSGTRSVGIELLRDGDQYGVLFSTVDDPTNPSALTCCIGFSNAAKACNVWHDRGFPLVDAVISEDKGRNVLQVVSSFFRDPQQLQYEELLLELGGIDFDLPTSSTAYQAPLTASYHQDQLSPDRAQPDLLIARERVTWIPPRSPVYLAPSGNASAAPAALRILPPAPRSPSLAPLSTTTLQAVSAWVGRIKGDPTVVRTQKEPPPLKASDTFGLPAYRFEDVEILGFRIDLNDLGQDIDKYLAKLVEPLNFHLAGDNSGPGARRAIPDFRYQAATYTLAVELLRYGRMKSRAPVLPLTVNDYQSQHELVVRLLVGRVDDDTAQAREPAVYVPAIFVDNPWSKILGRDLLGFDKRMATFAIGPDTDRKRLLPDGRVAQPAATSGPPPAPVPLGEISRVSLVERTGAPEGLPLLDLDYSTTSHTDPDTLLPIDLDLAFSLPDLAGIRWRQSDFLDRVFRRSFAGRAVADSFRAFRCIQVTPIGDRPDLPRAWITGTFLLDPQIAFGLPFGVANLTMFSVAASRQGVATPSAPEAWNNLCAMIGDGRTAKIRLATGGWYRLRCSMNLTIDDGLGWDD
jgi:hypothetical protein